MNGQPGYIHPAWAPAPMGPGPYGFFPPPHGGHHPHANPPPHYHASYPHGFCHSCCHPLYACVCGCRECRKEAKELLVAAQVRGEKATANRFMSFLRMAGAPEEGEAADEGAQPAEADIGIFRMAAPMHTPELLAAVEQKQVGSGTAFIGGGCCVHLSVEYTMRGKSSAVVVMVVDSEGTILAWGKTAMQTGYFIKEGIITTNPGATLQVVVVDAVARVRWCEVFSC